ncbi:DUF2177 domain-containing protein [Candidatus Parcubacteria bacterium]|nr:MAG: DUF2177 domain-containing protein [Candidatus Parcubacteria bacterium]
MQYIKVFLITLPIFFLVDMVWLGFVAKNFYQKHLGFIMGPVNWTAAIIFYLIFIVGLAVFVIVPHLESGSVLRMLGFAALFGIVTYATYDLTNLATLKDWPLIVTIVDLVWGMLLSSIVASASFFISRSLFY